MDHGRGAVLRLRVLAGAGTALRGVPRPVHALSGRDRRQRSAGHVAVPAALRVLPAPPRSDRAGGARRRAGGRPRAGGHGLHRGRAGRGGRAPAPRRRCAHLPSRAAGRAGRVALPRRRRAPPGDALPLHAPRPPGRTGAPRRRVDPAPARAAVGRSARRARGAERRGRRRTAHPPREPVDQPCRSGRHARRPVPNPHLARRAQAVRRRGRGPGLVHGGGVARAGADRCGGARGAASSRTDERPPAPGVARRRRPTGHRLRGARDRVGVRVVGGVLLPARLPGRVLHLRPPQRGVHAVAGRGGCRVHDRSGPPEPAGRSRGLGRGRDGAARLPARGALPGRGAAAQRDPPVHPRGGPVHGSLTAPPRLRCRRSRDGGPRGLVRRGDVETMAVAAPRRHGGVVRVHEPGGHQGGDGRGADRVRRLGRPGAAPRPGRRRDHRRRAGARARSAELPVVEP